MSRMRAVLASVLAFTFAVAACEGHTSLAPDSEGGTASASVVLNGNDGCTEIGNGLTAVVVNEDVVDKTVIIGDCDVGAYFDEDGVVENATFKQTDADPSGTEGPGVQFLVQANGADVDVTGSAFEVVDDYVHQILHIGYVGGATGKITDNTLTGFKRVGVLLAGAGTSATVKDNEIVGVGAKSNGWAENGIQISGGATGTVNDNQISKHWWDKNDFQSSGIILFDADGVTIQRNELTSNDASVAIAGNENNVLHNTIRETTPDGADPATEQVGVTIVAGEFFGATIEGEDNGVRQNALSTDGDGAEIGISIAEGATNTKLIRNTFDGDFGEEIDDGGEETKLPKPFDPEE